MDRAQALARAKVHLLRESPWDSAFFSLPFYVGAILSGTLSGPDDQEAVTQNQVQAIARKLRLELSCLVTGAAAELHRVTRY